MWTVLGENLMTPLFEKPTTKHRCVENRATRRQGDTNTESEVSPQPIQGGKTAGNFRFTEKSGT